MMTGAVMAARRSGGLLDVLRGGAGDETEQESRSVGLRAELSVAATAHICVMKGVNL
jgi:hypothetical protein